LEYARSRDIVIISYPSHATHVYQGLDVVCFGPFKKHWSDSRDKYERETGLVVQKRNFIGVMSEAFVKTFTPQTIHAAFRKTGVIPFNPSAIAEVALAPSLETSVKGSLPIRQPTPIREVVDALMHSLSDDEEMDDGNARTRVCAALTSTSAGFLVDPSEVPAEHKSIPLPTAYNVEPISPETRALLDYTPQTKQETHLLHALHEFAKRDQQHVEAARAATATAILQGSYCERLKGQLYAKTDGGQKKSKRLMGDGLAVLLTGDDFFNRATEQETRLRRKSQLKEARAKVDKKYKAATAIWKQENRERIDQNSADAKFYELELAKWKVEKEVATQEKRKPGWKKPAKPTRRPPIRKPTRENPTLPDDTDGSDAASATDSSSGSESEEEND
jgi:hypothetical protein